MRLFLHLAGLICTHAAPDTMDPVHIIAVEIKKIEHSWVAALDLLAEEANSPAASGSSAKCAAHRVPLHGYTAPAGYNV